MAAPRRAARGGAARRVAVATSGGRDSTALLHCTARAAAALGIEVVALHVNHGLQAQARQWQAHVQRQARRWGLAVCVQALQGTPGRGESVEAWARRGRYEALAQMARAVGCTRVLLAHHRQDQAETFLLQALRGGGLAGLAAMPRQARRSGITWLRPWLDQPRASIDAYVARHRIAHVEDPSNADQRWARNRIRHALWPALLSAFPDAEQALAAAAARSAADWDALQRHTERDLHLLAAGDTLNVTRWALLHAERRGPLLRRWLASLGAGAASGSLVERLIAELPGAGTARWPFGRGELRLYRARLSWSPLRLPAPAAVAARERAETMNLARPGRHEVPGWNGHFIVRAVRQEGVAADLLRQAQLRERAGGERLRLAPRGTARSLKKQYQARGVPPWQRAGPLVFGGNGTLLYVPGLGIDAAHWRAPGVRQLQLTWVPDPP